MLVTKRRPKPVPYMTAILKNSRVEWYDFKKENRKRQRVNKNKAKK